MTVDEMKAFEHSKEQRFYSENGKTGEIFLEIFSKNSPLNFEKLQNKKLILDLTSYIVAMFVRSAVHSCIKSLNLDGKLREIQNGIDL